MFHCIQSKTNQSDNKKIAWYTDKFQRYGKIYFNCKNILIKISNLNEEKKWVEKIFFNTKKYQKFNEICQIYFNLHFFLNVQKFLLKIFFSIKNSFLFFSFFSFFPFFFFSLFLICFSFFPLFSKFFQNKLVWNKFSPITKECICREETKTAMIHLRKSILGFLIERK